MELNFKNNHELFYAKIKSIKYKGKNDLESYVHALIDIEESIDQIYNVLIKEIIETEGDIESITEKLWDIREEFRHIDYHIKDAKLTE